jgi:hypothetical protein
MLNKILLKRHHVVTRNSFSGFSLFSKSTTQRRVEKTGRNKDRSQFRLRWMKQSLEGTPSVLAKPLSLDSATLHQILLHDFRALGFPVKDFPSSFRPSGNF